MKMCVAQVSFLILATIIAVGAGYAALVIHGDVQMLHVGFQIPVILSLLTLALLFGVTFACHEEENMNH